MQGYNRWWVGTSVPKRETITGQIGHTPHSIKPAMNKLNHTLHALVLLICISLASAVSFAAEKEAVKPTLVISVSAPPVWDPMREDDVKDAIYGRLSQALGRAGYQGKTVQSDRFDQNDAKVPVLEITVIRWRPERIGNVECTFSAGLKNGAETTSLGLFTGTSPQWLTTASRTWELRRGMDDSADAAVKNLVNRLRKDGLLIPAEKPKPD